MDPITIMTTISVGLKLVDSFREIALRFMKKDFKAPSSTVNQAGTTLQINHYGTTVETVEAGSLKLSEWDDTRYRALERRVKANYDQFYELYGDEPSFAPEEKARVKVNMKRLKENLCDDFKEMVQLYERALGTRLPDHYSLFEVCGN
jgi:hypothetical protein